MLGGALVESVGFPRLMLSLGVLNLLFSPLILFLRPEKSEEKSEKTALTFFPSKHTGGYSRFEDE